MDVFPRSLWIQGTNSGWARSLCDHSLAVPPPAPSSHWTLISPLPPLAPSDLGVEMTSTVAGPGI